VTDERQTDHAVEKYVAVGGIACAVRAIPPKTSVNEKLRVRKLMPLCHFVSCTKNNFYSTHVSQLAAYALIDAS